MPQVSAIYPQAKFEAKKGSDERLRHPLTHLGRSTPSNDSFLRRWPASQLACYILPQILRHKSAVYIIDSPVRQTFSWMTSCIPTELLRRTNGYETMEIWD
jgi:hypothetical protein